VAVTMRTRLAAMSMGCLLAPFGALGQNDLDCVIEASEIADVSSSVLNGIMEKVLVDRGDVVKQGQVVAQLEASVEQASVALARAQAESTTSIGAHEARVELARKELQRVRELASTQSVAARLVDEAETDLVIEQLALDQAHEDKRIAALELERAKANLELRTIRSPISGVVVRVHSSASETVEDQPIMQIARIDPLYVEAIAPVERLGAIHEGMVLQVHPEEPIGGQLTAKVSLVERVIDASSGTFGLRLELPNPEKVAYLTQTTLSVDDTRDCIEALRRRFPKIVGPAKDDICYATQNRQAAVKTVAGEVDVLLVIGAANSSNANRLVEVSRVMGTPSYLIADKNDIRAEWLANAARVGVTAGASTPEFLVSDVVEELRRRHGARVREVRVVEEDVRFGLPRELEDIARQAGKAFPARSGLPASKEE